MRTTKACSKHREAYAKVNADSEMWNADRFGCNTQGAAAPFWAGPCAPAASTALLFPSIGQRTSLRPPALVRIWAGDDKTLGSVLGRRKALSRGEGTAPAKPPYPHRTHTVPTPCPHRALPPPAPHSGAWPRLTHRAGERGRRRRCATVAFAPSRPCARATPRSSSSPLCAPSAAAEPPRHVTSLPSAAANGTRVAGGRAFIRRRAAQRPRH